MAMRALFAGPAAVRALVDGAFGTVALVFPRAAYVRLGDAWLLLAEPAVPFGPLSLAVDRLDAAGLRAGVAVHVNGGRLRVDTHEIRLERVRERRSPGWGTSEPVASAGAVTRAALAGLDALPRAPAGLSRGLSALRGRRIPAAVVALAGLGEGLTPAGDDVLAGYAAARVTLDRWAPRVPISALAARRASPLGLAYLRCAERGELPDGPARLLAAIRDGSVDRAVAAAPAVQAWGATSGVAFAWGISAAASRVAVACSATVRSPVR
jgi:hypothetical protein